VVASWRRGTRKKDVAPARRGMTWAAGISPRPVGAGSGIAARQWRAAGHERTRARAADGWDRATTGPSGQRLGARG
jgi:hypothetical protein